MNNSNSEKRNSENIKITTLGTETNKIKIYNSQNNETENIKTKETNKNNEKENSKIKTFIKNHKLLFSIILISLILIIALIIIIFKVILKKKKRKFRNFYFTFKRRSCSKIK
jgi:lipopolysaccharide/colanic/teichoic acid biosynthesis glycosyltransferase